MPQFLTITFLISVGPFLCSAATSCIPDFTEIVNNATTLQTLLGIAQAIPQNAENRISGWETSVQEHLTANKNSLNEKFAKYQQQFQGRINNRDDCKLHYKSGVNGYNDESENIKEQMSVDVTEKVRVEYIIQPDGKFQVNIKFIQDNIANCGNNCDDAIKQAKARLLKTHDDWCFCISVKLGIKQKSGKCAMKKGRSEIKMATWWLELKNCTTA